MNAFIIRVTILIIVCWLFTWSLKELAEVSYVPSWNNFWKNYLYIPGIILSVVIYVLLWKWLLNTPVEKLIAVIALIVCNYNFFVTTVFGGKYAETNIQVLDAEHKIYLSRIHERGFVTIDKNDAFRVYRQHWPLAETAGIMYAKEIIPLSNNNEVFTFQCISHAGIDTVKIPVRL